MSGEPADTDRVGGFALGATLADDAAVPPAGDEPERGQLIGRFVVLEQLGTGGMGVVYAAYDPHLDRKVAIKLLRAQVMTSDEARLRLLREAQAMARIDHPNVVRVHEAGTYGDRVFIAMEFAAGGTLRSWLAARPRSRRDIIAVFVQAGRGLAAAHAVGLVHRDFKPENVLMVRDDRASVTDFGLVGVVGEQPAAIPAELAQLSESTPLSQDLTRTGAMMGTPMYMAPEQFRGGLVGPAADQFAFCVALYNALYEVRPFSGATVGELCASVISGEITAAPRDSRVPARIRRALVRGLATEPERRHPSMTALLAELAPDHSRRTRVVAVGAAGVIAAGAIAFFALRPTGEAACTGSEARLASTWNPERRARLEHAFASSQRSDARAVVDRVLPIVDGWGHAWQQAYVGACEDTHVRKVQSEHVLDLRMDCLARQLDETRAVIEAISTGGDDAVTHALVAVSALPSTAACADTAALAAEVAPPATPTARQAVVAIRRVLDRVQAPQRLGRYRGALVDAQQALADARGVGYQPLLARALLRVGEVQAVLEDKAAATTLRDAMHTAIAAGSLDVALLAAADRIQRLTASGSRPIADELADLASAMATRGTPAAETIIALDNAVGILLADEGHRDRARARYEHALSIATTRLAPDARPLARTLDLLGELAASEGRFDDARKLFEQVLALDQRTLGPDHINVAAALDAVANIDAEQARLDESRQLHERALAIRIAALGPDHPDVADSLSNLGAVAYENGDLVTAKQDFERAFAIHRKAYGDDRAYTAESAANLSSALDTLGDHAAARAMLERIVIAREHAFSPDDPRVGSVLLDLGEVSREQHRFAEALASFERADAIEKKAYGPDHPETLRADGDLGATYTDLGKLREARELTSATLARLVHKFGPDDPRVGEELVKQGELLLAGHDPASAIASFRQAQTVIAAKLGADNLGLVPALVGLARAELALHHPGDAVPILEHALAIETASHILAGARAEAELELAKALAASPATRARARDHATAALAGYRDARDDDGVKQAEQWLKAH